MISDNQTNKVYFSELLKSDLRFNADEDEQALEQMKMYYPDYTLNNRIAQVDMTEIVKVRWSFELY